MPSVKDWDRFYINQAIELSNFSKAIRDKVGAVLVKNNRAIANGYNGTAPGTDNTCEDLFTVTENGVQVVSDVRFGYDSYLRFPDKYKLVTKNTVSHAEENLIAYCARNGISCDSATIYITRNPCMPCARLLANAGIQRVVYLGEYRDESAISYLRNLNILIEKFND